MEPRRPTFASSPLTWVVLAAAGVLSMTIVTPMAAAGGVRVALTLGEIALAAPTIVGLVLLGTATIPWWSTTSFGRADILRAATCGVALWVTSLGLFGLQAIAWPPPPSYLEAFQRLHLALRPTGPLDAALSLAAVSLAPAVGEELVFRGALLVSLRKRFGGPVAVALTALAFGSIHLDVLGEAIMLYRVPFAILIGMGLATLRLRTGSLAASMLAHATVNALTFTAVVAGLDDASSPEGHEAALAATLLLLGGAATVTLLALRRQPHPGRPQHPG